MAADNSNRVLIRKENKMPVYICRWSNGDVSLAAGESEVEVADVLDEVDNPDAAELMQLDHAIAVHFKLGTRPGEEERCLCDSKI